MSKPLGHAIIDIHAPLRIEYVAIRLERLWDLFVLKFKQGGEGHPHVAALTGYG